MADPTNSRIEEVFKSLENAPRRVSTKELLQTSLSPAPVIPFTEADRTKLAAEATSKEEKAALTEKLFQSLERPQARPLEPTVPAPMRMALDFALPFSGELAESATRSTPPGSGEFGVPLDVESGVDAWHRFRLMTARTRKEEVLALSTIPGIEKVTWNGSGEPVIRVRDPKTGEPKDILADPIGLDRNDFLLLAANAPELIFGAIGASIGHAEKGIIPVIKSLFGMALGAETAGTLKDLMLSGEKPAQIFKRRALYAGEDVLLGGAMATGAKVGMKLMTPFPKQGPIQVNARVAQEILQNVYNVDYALTPGQITGHPFLLSTESFISGRMGFRGPMESISARQRKAGEQVMEITLGVSPQLVPTASRVGENTMRAIGGELAPLDFAISRETQTLLKAAAHDLDSATARATGIPESVKEAAVGSELFTTSDKILERYRNNRDNLYAQVYDDPLLEGGARNIDITDASKGSREILEALPKVENTVMKETGFGSRTINPEVVPEKQTTTFEKFISPEAIARLQQLANQEGGKTSLRELITIRNDVFNDLPTGGAIKSIPDRRLFELRDVLTKQIRAGLTELDPSGTLLGKWESANDYVAQNQGLFERMGVQDLFKDPNQTGAKGLQGIAQLALSSPDRWQAFSEFFGPASREMNLLKRLYADRIIGKVMGSDTINLGGVAGRIEAAFTGSNKAIAEQVFGLESANALFFAEAARQAKQREVNVDELANMLQSIPSLTKSQTSAKLIDLGSAQAKKAQAMRNPIKRKILTGEEGIDATSLTDAIASSSPKVFGEIWNMLNGRDNLQRAVRQRMLMKVFDEASKGDLDKRRISGIELFKILEEDSNRSRNLDSILGTREKLVIRALANVAKSTETDPGKFFQTSGGLAKGAQQGEFERAMVKSPSALLSVADRTARSFLASLFYTSEFGRKWAGSLAFAPEKATIIESPKMLALLIAGVPAANSVLDLAGIGRERIFAELLKQEVDEQVSGAEAVQMMAPGAFAPPQ